jgi:hypothetical protein
MARSALRALDLLHIDSLVFINDEADERAEAGRDNGRDDPGSHANEAAIGLDIAATAPDGTSVEPEIPSLPDTGPFLSFEVGGVTMMEPQFFNAKGGSKGKPTDGDGGGGGGGGGGGDPTLLSEYISGGDAATSFNIEIKFKGDAWTDLLQQAFIDVADYLSTIITDDIADVFFRGKVIDDIRIDAEVKAIDGEGGILGQAGPTAYRNASFLPATAVMQFDVADAAAYDELGLFDDIVLHEMLHSIGFGTMWDFMDLTFGSIAEQNLLFTGTNAMAAYDAEFGGSGGVPIEDDTGLTGTDGGHWDEEIFGNELMTGFIDNTNFLSAMTVAALEDMGYETLWDPNNPADPSGALANPITDALIV